MNGLDAVTAPGRIQHVPPKSIDLESLMTAALATVQKHIDNNTPIDLLVGYSVEDPDFVAEYTLSACETKEQLEKCWHGLADTDADLWFTIQYTNFRLGKERGQGDPVPTATILAGDRRRGLAGILGAVGLVRNRQLNLLRATFSHFEGAQPMFDLGWNKMPV